MKKNSPAVIVMCALSLALAAWAQAGEHRKHSLADLAGTWNLTEDFDGRTFRGYMEFSKTGEITKWVLANDNQPAQSGRLRVSANGRITGLLAFKDSAPGQSDAYLITNSFDLQVVSLAEVKGTRLMTVTRLNPATGKPMGVVHEESIPLTLTRR